MRTTLVCLLALALIGCRPLTYTGGGLAVLGALTVVGTGIGCAEGCSQEGPETEKEVDDRTFAFAVAFGVGLGALVTGVLTAGLSYALEPGSRNPKVEALEPHAPEEGDRPKRKRREEPADSWPSE